QKFVEAAHPFGIASRQVIVHGDDVNAFTADRVQIGGQGRNERLSFTGLHFGDLALMEDISTHELNVEMPHVQDALTGFSNHSKRINEKVVQRFTVSKPLA